MYPLRSNARSAKSILGGRVALTHSGFTSLDILLVNHLEGFQGNVIPIDGTLVARTCHERLSLVDEADD